MSKLHEKHKQTHFCGFTIPELGDSQNFPSWLSSVLLALIHLVSRDIIVAQDGIEHYSMAKDDFELLILLPMPLKR